MWILLGTAAVAVEPLHSTVVVGVDGDNGTTLVLIAGTSSIHDPTVTTRARITTTEALEIEAIDTTRTTQDQLHNLSNMAVMAVMEVTELGTVEVLQPMTLKASMGVVMGDLAGDLQGLPLQDMVAHTTKAATAEVVAQAVMVATVATVVMGAVILLTVVLATLARVTGAVEVMALMTQPSPNLGIQAIIPTTEAVLGTIIGEEDVAGRSQGRLLTYLLSVSRRSCADLTGSFVYQAVCQLRTKRIYDQFLGRA